MEQWTKFTHYAGLDWASDHHDVVAVDRQAQIVTRSRITHTTEGWKDLAARLRELGIVAVGGRTSGRRFILIEKTWRHWKTAKVRLA